jgi:phosphate transport system substrate-binding protein
MILSFTSALRFFSSSLVVACVATFVVAAAAQNTAPNSPPPPSPSARPGVIAGMSLPPQTQAPSSPKLQLDADLHDYRRVENVSGKLTSVGSSALTQLLNRWGDDLKKIHPALEFEIVGGGSGTAPPALLDGKADLAPMSRPMNQSERAAFRTKFGYEPTQVTIGLDALAIFVNKNNPLKQISLRDLDAVYSLTRKRGGEDIKLWGQLGLTGDWSTQPIRVFGAQSTQGMYTLFRADVLQGGEFRYDVRSEPVASAIVQGVGADDFAIGFASHVFTSARAKPIAVSAEPNGLAVLPTQLTVANDEYPLARKLFIYINRKPSAPLPLAVSEFVKYVCGKQGQSAAVELGNYPLTAALSDKECLSAAK